MEGSEIPIKNHVPSVDRAISILDSLEKMPDLNLKDISEQLKIPTSTCYNILSTLERRAMIVRDPDTGRYSLGLRIMQLGLSIYEKIDLRQVSNEIIKKLVEQTEETVYLCTLDSNTLESIVVDRLVSEKSGLLSIRRVGEKVPLYASGSGKSLLIGFDEIKLIRFFDEVTLKKYTEYTITSEKGLRDDIYNNKMNGYARSYSELELESGSISAPIKDASSEVIASISIAGPKNRVEQKEEDIIKFVKKAANDISIKLGYR